MNTRTNQYDGPITVTPDRLGDTVALANSVFRSGGGTMDKDFPLLYAPDRPGQLRIFSASGKPVSLVGMVIYETEMLGCSTRIAAVGSVCTDEAYRGCSLASRLFEDAVARAWRQEATVMLISGHRTLYTRRGAVTAGVFHHYRFETNHLPQTDPELKVTKLSPRNCQPAFALFDAEAVHVRRGPGEYQALVGTGLCENRPSRTYLIERKDRAEAVVTVNDPYRRQRDQAVVPAVCEFAGSRDAILSALAEIVDDFMPDANGVIIKAYTNDTALREACGALGIEPETSAHLGAIKLLNPERLWRDFQTLSARRIGPQAGEIHLIAQADETGVKTITFRFDGDELSFHSCQEATALLFGSPEMDPLADKTGPLVDLLRKALPLPLPQYGFNYV